METLARGLGAGAGQYPALPIVVPPLTEFRTVVLLVVDGLGSSLLDQLDPDSALMTNKRADITSVFPSTTTSAITTFLTGLAPLQHGLPGWHVYFEETGGVTAVLQYRLRGAGSASKLPRKAAHRIYDQRPFADRISVGATLVLPSWIIDSRYNVALSGKAKPRAYATLHDFFPTLADTVRRQDARQYIYAYYPELDRVAHEFGSASPEAQRQIEIIDRGFGNLLEDIRGTNSIVILTADHGFIDSHLNERIDLGEHPSFTKLLAHPLCGESRAAFCYVKNGCRTAFLDYVQEHFQNRMAAFESHYLLERGYFGSGDSHPDFLKRIGDYVLIMKGTATIKDWLPGESRYSHIGVHGGVSAAEMRVPLIVATA
jgi:predicted AlkP superfamily pyrophosphatase or phosphodiesterase